ncbi:hypothetical protein G9X64_01425 [Rhizobium sophorae]|uniref:Uncharacterized protein n=1 Tax=Rhizobium sophorae TaxID=1535242 RepID=A0A7Y3WCB0_9HYPH|nr:hypothetical protein [Rhizobium leguminosarum bv. viciae]NNU35185.1 hypothetical protein [Rhizobium sophorae]
MFPDWTRGRRDDAPRRSGRSAWFRPGYGIRQVGFANVWIVSTYWAVYLSLQEGIDNLEAEHLGWGLKQVTSLFKPYLSDGAKVELETMLRRPLRSA